MARGLCVLLLLVCDVHLATGFQHLGWLRAGAATEEHASASVGNARAHLWDRKVHGVHSGGQARRIPLEGQAAAGPLRNLQWLHFPKAGTSFIATLWGYGCGQGDAPLDLAVDHNAAYGCGQCYDQALMDRYPMEEYCRDDVFAEDFQVQHDPVDLENAMELSVVGLFRKPSQRLISAYNDHLHASGFSKGTFAVLKEACAANETAATYARFPGVAGCSARMLTGGMCTEDPIARQGKEFEGGRSRVKAALRTVNQMEFVGLTEEWDESVCLFHRMFGGAIYEDEFKNFHQGTRENSSLIGGFYDESVLEGFVDEADEAVYAAAKKRFEELRQQYGGGNNVSLCDGLLKRSDHQASELHANNGEMRKVEAADDEEGFERCADMGRECGLVAGTVDCGACPYGRLSLAEKVPSVAARMARLNVLQRLDGDTELTCSDKGQCLVSGKPAEELFSWHFQLSLRQASESER